MLSVLKDLGYFVATGATFFMLLAMARETYVHIEKEPGSEGIGWIIVFLYIIALAFFKFGV